GQHGTHGWQSAVSGENAAVHHTALQAGWGPLVPNAGGGRFLGTGTTATGRAGLVLGRVIIGAPVFTLDLVAQLDAVATEEEAFSVWLGSIPAPDVAPTSGFWFRHDAGSQTWLAEVRDGGPGTTVDTGVPVDTRLHRFRIVCDGGGNVFFFVDDISSPVALIATDLSGVHGPGVL